MAEFDLPRPIIESLAGEILGRAEQAVAPIDIAKVAQALKIKLFAVKPKHEISPQPLRSIAVHDSQGWRILVVEGMPRELNRFVIARDVANIFLSDFLGAHGWKMRASAWHDDEGNSATLAMALLMPDAEVRLLSKRISDVSILAKIFQVPESSMVLRLEMLNLAAQGGLRDSEN